jgi:hypothetical protein
MFEPNSDAYFRCFSSSRKRLKPYRHGLSCPLRLDPVTSAKADTIAYALIGEDPNEEKLRSAAEFAQAQLELQRFRSTRADLMAKVDHQPDMHELQLLFALNRYERYAGIPLEVVILSLSMLPNIFLRRQWPTAIQSEAPRRLADSTRRREHEATPSRLQIGPKEQ